MPLKTAGRRHRRPPLRGGQQHAALAACKSTCGMRHRKRKTWCQVRTAALIWRHRALIFALYHSIDLPGTVAVAPQSGGPTPAGTKQQGLSQIWSMASDGVGRASSMGCRVGIHNCHHELGQPFCAKKQYFGGLSAQNFPRGATAPHPCSHAHPRQPLHIAATPGS